MDTETHILVVNIFILNIILTIPSCTCTNDFCAFLNIFKIIFKVQLGNLL